MQFHQKTESHKRRARRSPLASILLTGGACLVSAGSAQQGTRPPEPSQAPPSLEVTRLTMGKWIETQQIIARERKDWQQDKEVLLGRLELIKKEIQTTDEKLKQAAASAAEAERKRAELVAESDQLKAAGAHLTGAVTAMEAEVRKLFKLAPEPVRMKAGVQLLWQRIPEDPAKTRVTTAERFQNVLGILNELNKANNEITINYEVHTMAGGRSAEVQTLYVGLAHAYYVSAQGEAGIGHPSADGWKWTPDNRIARDVLNALEIQQGKQSPAFVPLPVKIQ